MAVREKQYLTVISSLIVLFLNCVMKNIAVAESFASRCSIGTQGRRLKKFVEARNSLLHSYDRMWLLPDYRLLPKRHDRNARVSSFRRLLMAD